MEQEKIETSEIAVQEVKKIDETKLKRSVDDLYIEKRRKKKKIVYITSLAVSLALALVIIIMSCVKIDLRPKFVLNPDRVTIHSSEISSNSSNFYKDSDLYEDFTKIYNDIFTISSLSALFSGNTGNYDIDETTETFDPSTSNFKEALGENYVELYFNEPQKLYNKNGSEYVSAFMSGYKLSFNAIYFPFSNENMEKELTFYVALKGNKGSSTATTKTTIALRGNTYKIYKFLDKLRAVA